MNNISIIVYIGLVSSQFIFFYCQLEKIQNLNNKIEELGQKMADLSSKMDVYTSRLASTKEQICQIDLGNTLMSQKSSWIDAATANNYLLPIVAVALFVFTYFVLLPYAVPLILPYFFNKSLEDESKDIVESAASVVSQIPSSISKLGEEIATSPVDNISIPLVSSSVSEASASTSIPVRFTYSVGEEAVPTTTIPDSFVELRIMPNNTEKIGDDILNTALWEADNRSIVSPSLPSIDSSVPTTDEISSGLLNVLDEVSYNAIIRSLGEGEESVVITMTTVIIPPMGRTGPVIDIEDSIANIGFKEAPEEKDMSDFFQLMWDLA